MDEFYYCTCCSLKLKLQLVDDYELTLKVHLIHLVKFLHGNLLLAGIAKTIMKE